MSDEQVTLEVAPAGQEGAKDNTKEYVGLTHVRWMWRDLDNAKTYEEMLSVLARVKEAAQGRDVTIHIDVTPDVYVRIMGNAWFAKDCKEIEELTMRAYLDRAMQLMEYNIKAIAVKRRAV
jgi:hypothetical protein